MYYLFFGWNSIYSELERNWKKLFRYSLH